VILAAALLVLLGLGLFVGGLVTGMTALYWACVAACVVAAGLLVAARRQGPPAAPAAAAAPPADGPGVAAAASAPAADRPAEAPVTAAPASPAADAVEPPPSAESQDDDPPVEEVEVTDLLLVVDLRDDVFVLDEHPRYHLAECPRLVGREAIPLPLDEARTDGFTPCGVCSPDRTMAERERARRAGRST
jgi:hypothetical protein